MEHNFTLRKTSLNGLQNIQIFLIQGLTTSCFLFTYITLMIHLFFFISEGIQVGQYFGEFFIGQARRSNHKFESRYQYFHSWQVFKIFMILFFEGVRRKNIWFTITSHSTPDQKEGILDFNKSMFSNRFKKIFKESIKIISNSQIIRIII